MEDIKKNLFLGLGAMLAAAGASLCCTLPIAVAVLGAGSAAVAARVEPLRPWLMGFTALLLGFGFFHVEGMTCSGCEAGVCLIVKKLDGVKSVEASYEKRQARVTYDPKIVTPERIIGAIQELGYSSRILPITQTRLRQRPAPS